MAKQTQEPLRQTIKRSINQLKGEPQPHELVDDTAKPLQGRPEHWGYHLLLDISECNQAVDDPDAVAEFLGQLVEALDMEPIGPPTIVQVEGEEGRGTSAVQIITTSTITFHSDDQEWSAYIDIFSCKPYEPTTAINLVQEHFEPKHIGKLWLFRDAGKYPEK